VDLNHQPRPYQGNPVRFHNDLQDIQEPRGLPKYLQVVQDIANWGLDCGLEIRPIKRGSCISLYNTGPSSIAYGWKMRTCTQAERTELAGATGLLVPLFLRKLKDPLTENHPVTVLRSATLVDFEVGRSFGEPQGRAMRNLSQCRWESSQVIHVS